MQFHLFGTVRRLTGQKIIALELPEDATLPEALERLFASHPALREFMLDEAARLRPDLPLFVNGRNPRLAADYPATRLDAADVVSLFSPVASGRMNGEVLREPAAGHKE